MIFSICLASFLHMNPAHQFWEDVHSGNETIGEGGIAKKALYDNSTNAFKNFEDYLMLEFMRLYLDYKKDLKTGHFNKNDSITKRLERIDEIINKSINN